jgi:hypothetical protein
MVDLIEDLLKWCCSAVPEKGDVNSDKVINSEDIPQAIL